MPDPRPEKFRKKPIVVEAMQWDGTQAGASPIIDWVLASSERSARWHEETVQAHNSVGAWVEPAHIAIDVPRSGTIHVREGWWAYRTEDGEFGTERPGVFAANYEPAEDPAPAPKETR